jgi:uncharacterized FlaG/YvyC family protein
MPQKIIYVPQKIIDNVRGRVKKSPSIIDMFNLAGIDINEIDLVPMCFADLDVSATTDHGIIYFNIKLLDDGDFEKDDHYMAHELQHYCDQCTGTHPTQGSNEGEYLDNPTEIKGFNAQTKFISETRNEAAAEKYIEQVLDHHEVNDNKEREQRKEQLLELAGFMSKLEKKAGDVVPADKFKLAKLMKQWEDLVNKLYYDPEEFEQADAMERVIWGKLLKPSGHPAHSNKFNEILKKRFEKGNKKNQTSEAKLEDVRKNNWDLWYSDVLEKNICPLCKTELTTRNGYLSCEHCLDFRSLDETQKINQETAARESADRKKYREQAIEKAVKKTPALKLVTNRIDELTKLARIK